MSALDIQIGGEHYKNAKIQPIQYIEANGLGFLEGCVVKRITRHDKPTGKGRQDIEKAIHELQLLLEFRYPQAQDRDDPFKALAAKEALSVHNQRVVPVRPEVHTMFNPPGEDIYAEFAARINATERKFGKNPALGAGYGPVEDCPECGYPADAAGTHYATCSQLTAPEKYKAEAQVAFDEATEISEALARQVSAGTIVEVESAMVAMGEKMMTKHCPHCGSPEGYLHNPDCTTMRRGKSRLGQTLAELRAKQAEEEPAAAMDDGSPRMQAIGQNGEMGPEVYKAIDEAFAGAPEWAKYKAQDANGQWYWYECDVYASGSQWAEAGKNGRLDEAEGGEPNPNWRDTLITRT